MVDNVELPPWAQGDARLFVLKHRQVCLLIKHFPLYTIASLCIPLLLFCMLLLSIASLTLL